MTFEEFVKAAPSSERWHGVTKLPWGDEAFSERMLREHLSQAHDGGSRRSEIIDQHVVWILQNVLRDRPCSILDLGCGPGLYTQRLAERGFRCTGIDVAPRAIAHARREAERCGGDNTPRYILGDVARCDFDSDFGLVMMLHGEINVFDRSTGETILRKAAAALSPGGILLLERHRFEAVKAMGQRVRQWIPTRRGLFGDSPYLRLDESRWDDAARCSISLNWIIDAETREVTKYGTRTQAYTDDEYAELLGQAGLRVAATHESLTGHGRDANYVVIIAERGE
jgi:SAM-dependent methyltransferase